MPRILRVAAAVISLALLFVRSALAQVILSDNFSRVPAATHVGTPPQFTAPAPGTWISSWGSNNNFTGGRVSQTYTTYTDGENPYKNDAGRYSGNWLNNGSMSYPLKLNNSATTITEPIGIPGFAWVQINHNFATNAIVTNAPKLRITFDWYRTAGGNINWSFGNNDPTGVVNGNAGSPPTIAANDISLYWRGFQANTFGMRDHGALTAIGDTAAYIGSPNINTMPVPIRIEITWLTGPPFASGSTSLIEMWVAGVKQDLGGTDPINGSGYTFTWDDEGGAYMVFGSNNSPISGSAGSEVYLASGIDNLVITATPYKPEIFSQPVSQTNAVGTSATFSVGATGDPEPAYQWYFISNSVTHLLAGATNTSFTRNPVALTHDGSYFVVVTNSSGSTTSAPAVLKVFATLPAVVEVPPTNVTVIKGQPIPLYAQTDGSPPLFHEWRKNGAAVGAPNTNFYIIPASAYTDAGNWTVVVTNLYGAATSTPPAVVTVLDVTPPVVQNATNRTVSPAGPSGTVVHYTYITATDDKDGAVPVTLTPPSGSLFPPGVTVVKAAATDSSGNTGTAYFTVSVLGTVPMHTNWVDTFTVSGQSSDINFEYNAPGRQAGVLAPIRWSEPIGFDQYGANDARTHLSDTNTLVFSPFAPSPNLAWSSPAHEFLESPTYAIQFDVIPPLGDATNSWAGFSWGTPTPLRGPDQTGVGTIGGMGLLFRTSNQTNEIQIWQGGTVIHRGHPYYQGIGLAPLPTPPFRFRVEVSAGAIGDGSPALVRAYVNGTPVRLSQATTNEFVWVKTNGFGGGYFTLSALAQAPGQQDSIFDNVTVYALPSIWPSRSAITTIAGRSNQTFNIVVPPTLVATSSVTVVISNANPGVATLAGEVGGQRTLNFPAGGGNIQSVTVIGHAAGETTFTLSTTAGVPIGGRPVSVKVIGLPLHIANPSFEEPPIPGLPGYGAIPGWDVSDINYVGINPNLEIGGSLANNSRSTDGSYVALLRSVPSLFVYEQMIGTTISNLVPGQKYELSFQANARVGGANARMDVLLDGTPVLFTQIAPVDNSVVLPYKPVSLVFTAATDSVALAISNQSPGTAEAMVFVDGFAVKPLTPGRWSVAPWTGDEDSGIWSTNTYTHAFNFGRATNITINGVTFIGVAGANPAVAGQFVTANYPSTLQNSANNNLTGQSWLLARDFIYNGQQPRLSVQGLIPGAQYRLTLFDGGWADTQPGQRQCTWMGGGEGLTVDENTYGTGNGILLHYDFVAGGTEETIEGRVLGPGTYHTFAFANQLVALPVLLRITQVSPTQVRIAWPAAATGYVLQSSPVVASGYTNLAVTPGLEGDERVVYQTISGTRFYRLMKP